MYRGVSSYADQVDGALMFIMVVSAIIMAGIMLFVVYCLIKYNKNKHPVPVDNKGNVLLEITWTIIPTIIVMAMFYYGWEGYALMRAVPKNAMEITVKAKKWSWYYKYANGKGSSLLKVPINKPVKLLLESEDIIHSFFVPAFRIKEDCIPGRQNYLWFQAEEQGLFDVLCAEYCGDLHSAMLSKVEVVPQDQFQEWYDKPLPPEELGAELVKGNCAVCHSVDGTPMSGPTFEGIWERKVVVLKDGQEETMVSNEEYLQRAIVEPQADMVVGYAPIMPKLDLTEKEIQAIISYLKLLK